MTSIKTANIMLIILLGLLVIFMFMWMFSKDELVTEGTNVTIKKRIFGIGSKSTAVASAPKTPEEKVGG